MIKIPLKLSIQKKFVHVKYSFDILDKFKLSSTD